MENPPYDVTSEILKLIISISEKIGSIDAHFLIKPSPTLRKQNKIRTIHSSLKIEGNTLTQDQITALVDKKRIIGPKKDIQEVLNAIEVYDNTEQYIAHSEKSFLKAHKILLQQLIENPGKYRKQDVGIMKGKKVEHFAPPFQNVPYLMKNLFDYLKISKEAELIKSCVFHYELEFIHPFLDGNGRMGRLWQMIILKERYPLFEYVSLEAVISKNQDRYYHALALSDKLGKSTPFIQYMLEVIENTLIELLNVENRNLTDLERLEYFISFTNKPFKRKEYINMFKNLSTSTASRDLKKGLEMNLLKKSGEKNKTFYEPKN